MDAMLAKESSTVQTNLSRIIRDHCDMTSRVYIAAPLPVMGNERVVDQVGMKVVIMTFLALLRKGRYTQNLQWDSMQKTPTWYGNIYDAGRGYVKMKV